MYADIGQRPEPTKSNINTHLLDDNRVDYALLDHSVHEPKEPALQETSLAKINGKCNPLQCKTVICCTTQASTLILKGY